MNFQKKLRLIFDRAQTIDGAKEFERQFRFIPRGFALPNNTGWGVFDQKRNRFLSDAEIKSLSVKQIDERWVQ